MLNETQSDMLDELGAFTISSEELKLEKLLSQKGSTALVYSGFWKGSQVAIKKFNAFSTEEEKAEILKEAKIMLKGSKSSYLMSLKAICLAPYYAIAMELMPQGSLHDLLQSDCQLPFTIRYQIACDIGYGLRDLHDNEIIHRDLKSLNILLNNYRARLTDFGLAKETGSNFIQTILKTGGIPKGTFPWMAPELFEKGSTWTKEADIYSLGIVLLELVTGKIPKRNLIFGDDAFSIDHPKISDNCPKEIKPLLLSFQTEPKKRLKMHEIIEKLEYLLMVEQEAQSSSTLALKTEQPESKDKIIVIPAEKEKKYDEIKQESKNVYENEKKKNDKKECATTFAETAVPAINSLKPLMTTSNSELKESVLSAHLPRKKSPKPKVSPEQLQLQYRLVVACKRGGVKEVQALLQQGAKPDVANYKGEQPLGAAVWGMCPDVVDALLKDPGGAGFFAVHVTPMTWEACEKHNLKYYREIFIVHKFAPQTYGDWRNLLFKIKEHNSFITEFHLKKVDGRWLDDNLRTWENLEKNIRRGAYVKVPEKAWGNTEKGCASFRTQIKQKIESAIQPMKQHSQAEPVSESQIYDETQKELNNVCENEKKKNDNNQYPTTFAETTVPPINLLKSIVTTSDSEQLLLQNRLIVACKHGEENIVKMLLQQGAKADTANDKGEHPLGAAVWGMCPDVVNVLLTQTGGVALMTWEECEKHNLKHYRDVFIVPKFEFNYLWRQLLSKMDRNPFIRAVYVKKHSKSWQSLKKDLESNNGYQSNYRYELRNRGTEKEYVGFRTQIRLVVEHGVEAGKQPILQDQLVTACKEGNENVVKLLLNLGAQPDIANANDEHPLGAAVWGMCPDIVNALLKQTDGVAPMTWEECGKHNLEYYNDVFIISKKFDPQTFSEWFDLLRKMSPNLFIRAFHLKKVDEQFHYIGRPPWEGLESYVSHMINTGSIKTDWLGRRKWFSETEDGFVNYRTQIKQGIEGAKKQPVKLAQEQQTEEKQQNQQHRLELKCIQEDLKCQTLVQPPKSMPPLPLVSQATSQTLMPPPKPKVSPKQLALQDQLIAACKRGDEKAVDVLLFEQGAKPDVANAKGEQPLGAAVWGMCPAIVGLLLKRANDVAPMTWEECETHNLIYYKEVFIISKFDPQNYREWDQLLQKMDPSPFIQKTHLVHAKYEIKSDIPGSKKPKIIKDDTWEKLTGGIRGNISECYKFYSDLEVESRFNVAERCSKTENCFIGFRRQIREKIEFAIQPMKQQSRAESTNESQTCRLM